jgi:putative sigma-54 modulation protein
MQTSVTFKNLNPSEHLKAYIQDKLTRLDKYLHNPAEANVVLSVEKHRHIAEVNILGDRLSINGTEETTDMYSAIDMVLDKMEAQIKKGKQKVRERRGESPKTMLADAAMAAEADAAAGRVEIMSIDYKPMDVEEAVMQMNLSDDAFLVFTNARTDRVNVLYRRRNGDFGLIQPSN